jgi:hypothetical protein
LSYALYYCSIQASKHAQEEASITFFDYWLELFCCSKVMMKVVWSIWDRKIVIYLIMCAAFCPCNCEQINSVELCKNQVFSVSHMLHEFSWFAAI